jgi:hypothetical protein
LQGCDDSNNSSNVIVKIYGYAEYDCTEDRYRLTKATPLIPFLKINKWYTKTQFHEANYQEAIKPFKDMSMSTESLKQIAPTLQMSNQFLYELTRGIDCKNPKDLLF